MQKYTKQQIIEYLQNKIDAGEIISTSSFKPGMIKLDTIYKYLGCKNWTEVLEIIDRKDSIKFRKFLSKEEIEKEINTFIAKNKRFPKTRELWKIADHKTIKKFYKELSIKLCKKNGASVEDIKEHSNYNTFTIAAIFGGMFGLRLASGYPYIYKKNKIDYKKLKKDFKKLYKEIGKTSEIKLIKILREKEMPSINTIKRAFKVASLKELYKLLDQ